MLRSSPRLASCVKRNASLKVMADYLSKRAGLKLEAQEGRGKRVTLQHCLLFPRISLNMTMTRCGNLPHSSPQKSACDYTRHIQHYS